jgi:ribA/ribD-fused uncharacterized protein
MITEFEREYRWLSNFWPAPVVYDGVRYDSVEHAYVAAKTDQPELRLPLQRMNPGAAKRYGRTLPLRKGWDDMRIDVMRSLLLQKFVSGYLREDLLATGNQFLIEGNTWGDTFWGVCKGVGENHLGKLLMEIREKLRCG